MKKGTSSALHSVRIYYENAPGSEGSEGARMTGDTGFITLGAHPPFAFDARSAPDSRRVQRVQGPRNSKRAAHTAARRESL